MSDVFDEMEDGIIELDSPFAKKLGFTSDKFDGWLWKKGKYIYISFIISKKRKKGNLKRLLKRIEELGFGIKIPTPLGIMQYIVRKYGFKKTTENFDVDGELLHEEVEVWVKEPKKVIKIEQK